MKFVFERSDSGAREIFVIFETKSLPLPLLSEQRLVGYAHRFGKACVSLRRGTVL